MKSTKKADFETARINEISNEVGEFYRQIISGNDLTTDMISQTRELLDNLDFELSKEEERFDHLIGEFSEFYICALLQLPITDFKKTTQGNATKYESYQQSKGLRTLYSRLKLIRKVKKKFLSSFRFDKIQGDTKGIRIIRDHPDTPEVDFFHAAKQEDTSYLERIVKANPKTWQYTPFDINNYERGDFKELFAKLLDIHQDQNETEFDIDLVRAYVSQDITYMNACITEFRKKVKRTTKYFQRKTEHEKKGRDAKRGFKEDQQLECLEHLVGMNDQLPGRNVKNPDAYFAQILKIYEASIPHPNKTTSLQKILERGTVTGAKRLIEDRVHLWQYSPVDFDELFKQDFDLAFRKLLNIYVHNFEEANSDQVKTDIETIIDTCELIQFNVVKLNPVTYVSSQLQPDEPSRTQFTIASREYRKSIEDVLDVKIDIVKADNKKSAAAKFAGLLKIYKAKKVSAAETAAKGLMRNLFYFEREISKNQLSTPSATNPEDTDPIAAQEIEREKYVFCREGDLILILRAQQNNPQYLEDATLFFQKILVGRKQTQTDSLIFSLSELPGQKKQANSFAIVPKDVPAGYLPVKVNDMSQLSTLLLLRKAKKQPAPYKDYTAHPKKNGYKGRHAYFERTVTEDQLDGTTTETVDLIELQYRTSLEHFIDEVGSASYQDYSSDVERNHNFSDAELEKIIELSLSADLSPHQIKNEKRKRMKNFRRYDAIIDTIILNKYAEKIQRVYTDLLLEEDLEIVEQKMGLLVTLRKNLIKDFQEQIETDDPANKIRQRITDLTRKMQELPQEFILRAGLKAYERYDKASVIIGVLRQEPLVQHGQEKLVEHSYDFYKYLTLCAFTRAYLGQRNLNQAQTRVGTALLQAAETCANCKDDLKEVERRTVLEKSMGTYFENHTGKISRDLIRPPTIEKGRLVDELDRLRRYRVDNNQEIIDYVVDNS
ncbi:hypothetical protein HN587_05415 [Candidatus Woesearchaeota archaeon]|jgi:hypothetical protein|nr:hypothetical protein [Candidatus Woesearchaeota archaeon]